VESKKKYTYAQTVKMPAAAPPAVDSARTMERRSKKEKKENYEVILIKSEKIGDKRTNDEIKTQVIKRLKDKRNKLKDRNIRQLRNKGIVIEVNSQVDVDIINRSNLESVGLVITAPKELDPSIVIYDVEKDCSRDELKKDFIEKNLPWSSSQERCDLEQVVNFKYSFKSRNDKMINWVVQLPGSHFHKIINAERVFMGWKTYRIKEYINTYIVRCFKCHGYAGHMAKTCSVLKQRLTKLRLLWKREAR